ncbi:MAG TPA: cytochrome P450 [Solirubrobacteraceae bacterium]|jgi:cytochrome P450
MQKVAVEAVPVEEMVRLTSYDEIDEVLRGKSFVQGAFAESKSVHGGVVTELDGPPHFERRRTMGVLVRGDALASYELEVLIPDLKKSIERVRAATPPGEPPQGDLVPMIRTLLYRFGSRLVGLDDVDSEERITRLLAVIRLLTLGSTVHWSDEDHDTVMRRAEAALADFDREFVGPSKERRKELIAAWRRGEIEESEIPRDVITLHLMHPPQDFDEGLIVRESKVFLSASTSSSTAATAHAVEHFSRWLDAHPEDVSRLDEFNFVRAALAEAIRLHPTQPGLIRRATEDLALRSGREVRAGEYFMLEHRAGNRDKTVWGEDADEFNPDRREGPRARPYGFGFGGGRHVCMGQKATTGVFVDEDVPAGGEDEPQGNLVRVLQCLMKEGARPDPDRAPVREATKLGIYRSYPVVFTPR